MQIKRKLSFFYLQTSETGASSFVLDAHAAPALRLRIVEPFESSPYLARVVFARGKDGIAGVIESAREKFVVVTRENLCAKSVVGLLVELPQPRRFIGRRRENQTSVGAEANF